MKIEKDNSYVLDTFAILAFLKKEPGGKKINTLLHLAAENKCTLYLNEVNLGEIYYRMWKDQGEVAGKEALYYCLSIPVQFVTINRDFILKAASWKAQYPISYADAFCLETAIQKKCPLITGDPEFTKIPGIKIIWLKKNQKMR